MNPLFCHSIPRLMRRSALRIATADYPDVSAADLNRPSKFARPLGPAKIMDEDEIEWPTMGVDLP